jgi:hypothetical protein
MLHRIELTLGQHVFETDRTSVRWSPAVELKLDSHLFESACDRGAFEEACLYYRGDFLAGFSLADCPEFEDWAFFRREALRGRLMHGLERLVQDRVGGSLAASSSHTTVRTGPYTAVRQARLRWRCSPMRDGRPSWVKKAAR